MFLKANKVAYTEHEYDYVEHGGTEVSAVSLGVPEHAVVKTLVMQDEAAKPLIVLMHGDKTVSTKNLARRIGAKSVEPCTPDVAQRHSGFLVGGPVMGGVRASADLASTGADGHGWRSARGTGSCGRAEPSRNSSSWPSSWRNQPAACTPAA